MTILGSNTTGATSQSNSSTLPSTPNNVPSAAPETTLPAGMVIPYIRPGDLGLTKPKEEFSDFRPVNQATGTVDQHSERVFCQVGENHWTTRCQVRAQIWNWGSETTIVTDTPSAAAAEFKSRMPKYYNLPITTTLVQDLHAALYRQRLQDEEQKSPVFKCLKDRADEFLDYILLSFDHENFFETGRPISHTVLDIIACVSYLRKKAEMENDQSCMSTEFSELRSLFWKGKLVINQPWLTTNWKECSKIIAGQANSIFEKLRYILLLDPRKPVTPDPNNIGLTVPAPYFRHWDDYRRLREHPVISSTRVRTFRGDIYNSAGIKPGELKVSINATTNLSDFRASVIRNGAFKIELTKDPSLHLRFDENSEMRPTLHILDTRTVSTLALLDLTGFMSSVGLPTYLEELLESHALFFGRSTPKPKVMASQFAGIDMSIVREYHKKWSSGISTAHITDFPIYGSRLQSIHQRMTDWRPLHVEDLRHRPYRDSVAYYAFMFAALFSILGFVEVFASVWSAFAGGSKG